MHLFLQTSSIVTLCKSARFSTRLIFIHVHLFAYSDGSTVCSVCFGGITNSCTGVSQWLQLFTNSKGVSQVSRHLFFLFFFSSHPTRKFTVASFTFSAHYQCEQRSPLCLPRVIQVTFGVCLLCGYVICADMTCIKGQHCLWAWRLKRSAWDSKLFQLCYGLETILFRHFDQFSSGPVSKCNVCGIHSICSII